MIKYFNSQSHSPCFMFNSDNMSIVYNLFYTKNETQDKIINMDKIFTCSSCTQEKPVAELANTVEVYKSEPVKTCRECSRRFLCRFHLHRL